MTPMTHKRLSISVAMCTFNGSRFLPEQLASIAGQSRLPDEMVICDDGSTDTTLEIVEKFSRGAPFPVRLIRNPENLGSTKNFEKATSLCTGDLIALSDQDDIWMPEKLAIQGEMMERDADLGGVFSDAELIDARSTPLAKRLWAALSFTPAEQRMFGRDRGASILLRKYVVTGATFMVRASLREHYLPISEAWGHEAWVAWILAIYSHLRLIEQPLIRYRIHASQQVGIGNSTQTLPRTLRERLEKGKREEPGKLLARANELKELEKWLAATA